MREVCGHTHIFITDGKLRDVTMEDAGPGEAPWLTTRVEHSEVGVRTARLLTFGKRCLCGGHEASLSSGSVLANSTHQLWIRSGKTSVSKVGVGEFSPCPG